MLWLAAGAAGAWGCSTEHDCQLNGVCEAGVCHCDPAWGSPDCSVLQLEADGTVAYGGPDAEVTPWDRVGGKITPENGA